MIHAPERHYFDEFASIVKRLRDPGGCPWDREQKLADLRAYIVEEAYELTDAITAGDMDKVREEAGDLLLQIVFLSAIASETEGTFGIEDVVKGIGDKLIRRHPHVFPEPGAGEEEEKVSGVNSEQVIRNWERIKQQERKDKKEDASILSGLPKGLPPLLKAHRMQGKAAHVGFDWPQGNLRPLFDKLDEEVAELKEAVALAENEAMKNDAVEDELGDLLFMTVNLARHLNVNPDSALSMACNKFAGRFQKVELKAAANGRHLNECSLEELDTMWEDAKKEEGRKCRGL
ncbi:MAG: nucleoside triphosphate pyrophosphohydrolase [Synergistaceae bacterium]|nr:nucleoside triphosphate pyrophosphohydrolase [Synergistaceae bacterium]